MDFCELLTVFLLHRPVYLSYVVSRCESIERHFTTAFTNSNYFIERAGMLCLPTCVYPPIVQMYYATQCSFKELG